MRQCYLTVTVKDTDYDEADEHVISTTANGEEVHGRCSPLDGAVVDAQGMFECAKYAVLPPSRDGSYTFVTTITPTVNENPYEGSFLYVEYMVDCEGTCMPPSSPPLLEPAAPPPLPPTCEYSATPANGGNGGLDGGSIGGGGNGLSGGEGSGGEGEGGGPDGGADGG